MDMTDERIKVANSMIKYGGSFIKCIGEALLHADNDNTIKLKSCFSEEWFKYLDISEKYMDRWVDFMTNVGLNIYSLFKNLLVFKKAKIRDIKNAIFIKGVMWYEV